MTDRIEIPHQTLSEQVLQAIVEEFVLREGTDYGPREFTLEEKVAHVIAQLKNGKAKIVYDDVEKSCDVVPVSA